MIVGTSQISSKPNNFFVAPYLSLSPKFYKQGEPHCSLVFTQPPKIQRNSSVRVCSVNSLQSSCVKENGLLKFKCFSSSWSCLCCCCSQLIFFRQVRIDSNILLIIRALFLYVSYFVLLVVALLADLHKDRGPPNFFEKVNEFFLFLELS